MDFLKREDLLGDASPSLAEEVVTISWRHPQTGKRIKRQVTVRERTVAQKTAFEIAIAKNGVVDEAKIREAIVVADSFGPDGKPVFGPEDAAMIGQLGSGIFEPIVEASLRLSKTTTEDLADLAKKSEATGG